MENKNQPTPSAEESKDQKQAYVAPKVESVQLSKEAAEALT